MLGYFYKGFQQLKLAFFSCVPFRVSIGEESAPGQGFLLLTLGGNGDVMITVPARKVFGGPSPFNTAIGRLSPHAMEYVCVGIQRNGSSNSFILSRINISYNDLFDKITMSMPYNRLHSWTVTLQEIAYVQTGLNALNYTIR